MPVRTRPAGPADLADAARVWRAANIARGRPPEPDRMARIEAKLADPEALVLVAVDEPDGTGGDDTVVGVALAEPGRTRDGAGAPEPGLCHLSLVFVDPGRWGRRIGRSLLDAVLTRAAGHGYTSMQVWTGERNERALRLYEGAGFRRTGRTGRLATGTPIVLLVRDV